MPHNGGPSCPKPQRLRELIDVVGDSNIDQHEEHDLIEALEWLATSLENRSLYHKKQQIKKKIVFALAREHGLYEEADSLTNSELDKYIGNQPPDKEDEIDLDLGDNNEDK